MRARTATPVPVKNGRQGWRLRKKTGVFLGAGLMFLGAGGLLLWYVAPARAAQQGSLVGYWKLDEGSGTTAADISGNANNGTYTSSPSPNTNVPTTSFPDSHSLNFDGVDDKVTVQKPFSDGQTDFTISLWVNPAAINTGSYQGLVGREVGDSQHRAPGMWVAPSNGGLHYNIFDASASTYASGIIPDVFTSTNQWVQITWVKRGTQSDFYRNGVLVSGNQASPSTFYEGDGSYNFGGVDNYLQGKLDDIRIYNRALSAAEVGDLGTGKHTTATWTSAIDSSYEKPGNWDIGAVPDAFTNIVVTNQSAAAALQSDTGMASLRIESGGGLFLGGYNLTLNDDGTFSNDGTLQLHGNETLTNIVNDTDSGGIAYDGTGTYTDLPLGDSYYDVGFGGGGTWTLPGGTTLDIGNIFDLASGTTLNAGSSTINVGGWWVNFANFNAGTSTVNLTGANQLIYGNTTFYNLNKIVTAADTLTIMASSTQTITHNLHLAGASGNLLSLVSSAPGTQWKLNPSGTSTLSYLNVQDSDNLGSVLKPANSTDGGGNNNWNLNAPNAPDNLGAARYLDGSYDRDTTPIMSYILGDTDTGDTVKYRVQLSRNSDYSSPVVDYTSALGSQGISTFTVGQAAGGGSYTVGSSGQTLAEGAYYWRVMAIDSGDNNSAWTTASSGSPAFQIDTTAPTTPGKPSASTDSSDTTPTWSWSASSDSGSGLATLSYNVQWSRSDDFAGLAGTDTSTSASYTVPDELKLSDGMWYFRVQALDAVGNVSSWSATGAVYVNTTVLTGGSAISNEAGTPSAISDLQVTSGETNPTVTLKLFVSHGTISLATTTGLTFYNADGTTRAGQPTNSADLQFGGSLNDVNTALATLRYTRTSGTGSDTLSASLVQPGEVFFSGNNHLYEYVAGPATWSQAKTAAEQKSKYGAQGYLATITSQAENDFIKDRLKSDSWIGASDSDTEGAWLWKTGPEDGQQFWQGTGSGNTTNGMYAHWNNPKTGGSGAEPNQSNEEDCGEFYYSNNGLWNDLACSSPLGYIVEYGGLSGIDPIVASKNVAITTVTDNTPPSQPGKPTISPASPTTNTTPALTWTASADSGTGLANPAYTVQWSHDAAFTTVTGSATTNSTAYTFGTSLSDGTWYFRINATDISGNIAASSISSAFVLDTQAPDAPAASPAGGAYTSAQTISLSANDNAGGSDIDTIYYTIDGSTPDDSSTAYSSPITLSASTTIKAAAYDKAGNASDITTETYTITHPQPTNGGGASNTPSPTHTASPSHKSTAITSNKQSSNLPAASTKPATNPERSDAEEPLANQDTTPNRQDTIQLNNATEKPSDSNSKDTNGQNTSAFLGLGWWWLPVLVLFFTLWWLLFAKRRKRRE